MCKIKYEKKEEMMKGGGRGEQMEGINLSNQGNQKGNFILPKTDCGSIVSVTSQPYV